MRKTLYTNERPMRVILTARQSQQLAPYFDRVNASAVLGSPGMLVGQFAYDTDRGNHYITVAFLDHAKAAIITECGRADIPGSTKHHDTRSL
jgi:hypothetical protein